jgi:hypothetical protein
MSSWASQRGIIIEGCFDAHGAGLWNINKHCCVAFTIQQERAHACTVFDRDTPPTLVVYLDLLF